MLKPFGMLTFLPGRVLLTYRDFDLDVVKEVVEAPADNDPDFDDEPTLELPRSKFAVLKALVLGALFIALTGCLTDPTQDAATPPPTLTAPSLDDEPSDTGELDDEVNVEADASHELVPRNINAK